MVQGPTKSTGLNRIKVPSVKTTPGPDIGITRVPNFFRQATIAVSNQAKVNALEGVTLLKAIVLRVEESSERPSGLGAASDEILMSQEYGITDFKKIVRFRGYIPELFPYPVPKSFDDHRRIDKFPIFSSGDETLPEPTPGDIVVIGFENLEELSGGTYLGMAAPGAGQKKVSAQPGKCPPPKVMSKGPKGRLGGNQGAAAHTGLTGTHARLRITPRRCVMFGGNAIIENIGGYLENYLFSKGWTLVDEEGKLSDVELTNVPKLPSKRYAITRPATPFSDWILTADSAPFSGQRFEDVRKALRTHPDLVIFSFDGFGDYFQSVITNVETKAAAPGLMKKITAQFVSAVRQQAVSYTHLTLPTILRV